MIFKRASLISQKKYKSVSNDSASFLNFALLLGGMWGVSVLGKPDLRAKLISQWKKAEGDANMWKRRNEKGPDQRLMTGFYWDLAKPDSVGHDSYLCKRYPNTKAFPTQRWMNISLNFVGSESNMLKKKCPPQCRPKNHQDWEYC